MIVIIVLVLCAVRVDGLSEGDSCSKKGVAGVCANIRLCPDAQQDVKNKEIPQLCDFSGMYPIVCCISLKTVTERPQTGKCVLPPYPRHGFYVSNVPNSKVGEAHDIFVINVTCIQGYDVEGPRSIICEKGWWQHQLPKCVPLCRLEPDQSIDYSCQVSEGGVNGTRPCREHEPQGTVARPQCRYPNFFSPTALEPMRCVDGAWSYDAKCVPVCGTVVPAGEPLSIGGRPGTRGELPWRAYFYFKKSNSYKHFCGGALISTSIVITAAHCFATTDSETLVKRDVVAVGKMFKQWDHPRDQGFSQRADLAKIHFPQGFQGLANNLQDDIALAVTAVAFKLTTFIRPVCLDFDPLFDKRQLQPGNKAVAGGLRYYAENSTDVGPPELLVLELSYIDEETCIKEIPEKTRARVTTDKFCASDKDSGSELCIGDGGGGLAFLSSDKDVPRYYLRGIFSNAHITEEGTCKKGAHMFFTRVQSHEHFIKKYWTERLQV